MSEQLDLNNPGIGTTNCTTDMGFGSGAGVLIGIPMCGRPLSNLWGIYFSLQDAGTNASKCLMPMIGVEVGKARQAMAEAALAPNHEPQSDGMCPFCKQKDVKETDVCPSRPSFPFLWFVDDDVILPPQCLRELIDKLTKIRAVEKVTLGEEKTVAIGGIYSTKEPLSTPVAYKKLGMGPSWDWVKGQIFNVEGIGTGCLLIHTSVFNKLEKPWFKTVDEDVRNSDGNMTHMLITDDLYFCQKVKDAGYKIVAHGGVLCGHYDYKSDKIFGLPADSPPIELARKYPEWCEEALSQGTNPADFIGERLAARRAEAAQATYIADPSPSAGVPSALKEQ